MQGRSLYLGEKLKQTHKSLSLICESLTGFVQWQCILSNKMTTALGHPWVITKWFYRSGKTHNHNLLLRFKAFVWHTWKQNIYILQITIRLEAKSFAWFDLYIFYLEGQNSTLLVFCLFASLCDHQFIVSSIIISSFYHSFHNMQVIILLLQNIFALKFYDASCDANCAKPCFMVAK